MEHPIEGWTTEGLRILCKKKGFKNYGHLRKRELYDLCYGKTLLPQDIPQRTVKKKFREAVSDSLDAVNFIEFLKSNYPEVLKTSCETYVSSPIAGSIIKENKMVGVVDREGEIVPLTIPIPPPPPSLVPRVITRSSAEEKKMFTELEKKKKLGITIDEENVEDLLTQIKSGKTLKPVTIEEIQEKRSRVLQHQPFTEELIRKIEGKIPLKKVDIEMAKEESRKYREAKLVEESRGGKILQDIKKGVTLRKISGGYRSEGECGYGLYWDSRLRLCIPYEPKKEEKIIELSEKHLS